MYDRELVCAVLTQVRDACITIKTRVKDITGFADFTNSPAGMEKLDSICMLFIAIGESLKNIDKITRGTLLENYPLIDWVGVKGFRDIIAHHYFDIDPEQVYWLCTNNLDPLLETISKIIKDIQ